MDHHLGSRIRAELGGVGEARFFFRFRRRGRGGRRAHGGGERKKKGSRSVKSGIRIERWWIPCKNKNGSNRTCIS